MIERVEKLANPLKDEGEWVTKVDLVEQGSRLVAKEMDQARVKAHFFCLPPSSSSPVILWAAICWGALRCTALCFCGLLCTGRVGGRSGANRHAL